MRPSIKKFKQYQAYLFDLDGTLVHTAPDIESALNHSLETSNLQIVDQSLTRKWVGHGARTLIEKALKYQHRDDQDTEILLKLFLNYYEENLAKESKAYPTVETTLRTLRKNGAKLAVVTNKLSHLTEKLLYQLDLKDYFDVVVCGNTAPRAKPFPDAAILACQHLEVKPKDALFVGDSDPDVKCARAAGCPIVCVSYGYNQGIEPNKLGGDHVICSMDELL